MEHRTKRGGVGVTEDAWQQALTLLRVAPTHPNAVTTIELCTRWGCSERTALRRVKQLVQMGKASRVVKSVTRTDGAFMLVPAYILI